MFKSFFLAGFEGTTGYNKHRQWIDQVVATQHDRFLREDYARVRSIGIHTVRESVRWPLVDRKGHYDFSSLHSLIEAAREHQIDVLYDLFHFGYPEDIDPFSSTFSARFADYCYAVARCVSENTSGVCAFAPVNEPSFLAWAAGEVGLFAPHAYGRGWELKVRLIEAAIQGINAIWSACPDARIVNIDPICRVAAPAMRIDAESEVADFNSRAVFQGWDMLAGRLKPELGGSRRHLGVVGVNYYWTNQWELGDSGSPLPDDDERRWSLSKLLASVWLRYGGEMLITESAHIGEARAGWVRELACEVEDLLDQGIPLEGVCLYPVIGMQDWHSNEWPRMGLWDLVRNGDRLDRIPVVEAIQALREAQRIEQRHRMARNAKSRIMVGGR